VRKAVHSLRRRVPRQKNPHTAIKNKKKALNHGGKPVAGNGHSSSQLKMPPAVEKRTEKSTAEVIGEEKKSASKGRGAHLPETNSYPRKEGGGTGRSISPVWLEVSGKRGGAILEVPLPKLVAFWE